MVACSDYASRCGVLPGMPVAEATAVFSAQKEEPGFKSQKPESSRSSRIRNPKSATSNWDSELRIEEHDPLADRAALEQLALWCEQFSPSVGLEDAPQPDCLLLDITGLGPLFGGEDLLAERAQRTFDQRGLLVQLAIADTIGAAWAAARYGLQNAKCEVRSENKSAIAPFIIPSGGSLPALRALPVRALRLPEETLALLEELGICEIGQLLALPRSALAARFGSLLVERLDQALGAAADIVAAHHPPPEFEAEWLLEHATDRQEMIHFVLETLIERVSAMLAARGRGALELLCQLNCQGNRPVEVSVGLFRPSASPKHLWQLVYLRLEHVRLHAPVELVRITMIRTAPLEIRQQSLFEEGNPASDRRQLGSLVDRLSNRLSRESVLRPELVVDAQPEFAYRYRTLTDPSHQRRTKRRRSVPAPAPGDRPLWLHQRPLPLEVISVAPGGKPARFRLQKNEYQLSRTWGPERIETGWWRGGYVRRDYYRVETTRGERFWIFRRLTDRQWFLQGEDG